MPAFDPPVLTSWTGWPDLLEGPYFVVLHWALTDDAARVECVGLDLRTYADESLKHVEDYRGPRAEQAADRAITTDLWRSIRVRELIDRERRAFAEHMDESPWAEIWSKPPPRGDYLRRGDHEAVAAVYLHALAAGKRPRKAVAETFHLSPSAAAKRIARAREHGLIPATSRGRTHETRQR